MSAQSILKARAVRIAAGACLAALALIAHQARSASARTSSTGAALEGLEWGLPVALSVAVSTHCDTISLDSTAMHCNGVRSAESGAAPVSLSSVAAAGGMPPAESRHRRALVDLWYAQRDSVARARGIRGLRESVVLQPDAAPALIDLAAALLIDHAQTASIVNLLEALDVASRALQVDPKSSAAAWNRAVALTWLGLHDQAQSAWREYATISGASAPVTAPTIDPQRASPRDAAMNGRWIDASRKYFWGTMLRDWGEAVLAGDWSRTRESQDAIDSLVQRSQDHDTRDSPAAIARLIQSTAPSNQRRSLATGFVAMARLRDALEQSDLITAQQSLRRATEAPAFQAGFSRWTQFEAANLLLRTGNASAARREFSALLRATTPSAPAVSRRAAWGLALTFLVEGQTAVALDSLRALLPRCVAAREEECVVAVGASLAGAQSAVGDEESALSSVGAAVAASSVTPLTHRRWTALDYLRMQADRLGLRFAYSYITDEEAAVARSLGRIDLVLLSSRLRAERLLANHDLVAATAEVTDLVRVWATHASPSVQDEYRWDVLWMRGELARQQHNPVSVALLDSAVRASEEAQNPARSYPIRLARARARMAAGDSATAFTEFDSLLTELRARASSGASVLDAVRLAEVSRETANDAARSLLASGFAIRALDALSGRRFGATRALRPYDPTRESIAIRELGDSLILWRRDLDGVHVLVSSLGARSLGSIVHELDSTTLAREYDAVIRPWASASPLRPAIGLSVDARGVAAGIPWAALRDRTSGRYLVEQRDVSMVDDALDAGGEMPESRPSTPRVLLIDAAALTGAHSLPEVEREIESLATVWGSLATVTSTASANVPVERAMAQADLVHFAGHAVIDDRNPARSALSITTAHGDSLIRAEAIARWHLPRTRLVVLSACDTRVAGGTPLGGLESLSGVLRSIGVRSVIGAGWSVEDRATAALMLSLHRQLRNGARPAAALRSAQLQMLRSSDHSRNTPRVWAAFQVMGH